MSTLIQIKHNNKLGLNWPSSAQARIGLFFDFLQIWFLYIWFGKIGWMDLVFILGFIEYIWFGIFGSSHLKHFAW